jgi:phage tail sheath protein FI
MPTYKTPGVYTEEISKFPPSVAEVATAIPAFIGYTEKAERYGLNLTNVPTRIKSLLEYHEAFGGEFVVQTVDVVVNPANNYAVQSALPTKRFFMYEALRLYFDNGGGACYIVSVGPYTASVAIGDEAAPTPGIRVGLKALEKYDEPTIIVSPDAALLTNSADFYSYEQRALDQAARLMDRVAVLDLREYKVPLSTDFVQEFRDTIGINNLKYGAAYTPYLFSAYPKAVPFSMFNGAGRVKDTGAVALDLANLDVDPGLNQLVINANVAIHDRDTTIKSQIDALRTTFPTLNDRYSAARRLVNTASTDTDRAAKLKDMISLARSVAVNFPTWRSVQSPDLRRDLDAMGLGRLRPAVVSLIQLEKVASVQTFTTAIDTDVDTAYAPYVTAGWITGPLTGVVPPTPEVDYTKDPSDATITLAQNAQVARIVKEVDKIFADFLKFIDDVETAAATRVDIAETTLYQTHPIIRNIVTIIVKELGRVPPSGAVAGVYAFVDRTRGVWKAPANVSLASVIEPARVYDYYDQEDLNVDVNGGKSINAIRTFTGAGVLVWGARTLAGNDNEWRYVPVRRFFNMVEESVKKSTAWAVFEPNDANLWTKVKGMIDNYLIQKWRDGALVGGTPDKAFYTRVGLGVTMTAQDILEGRLIIEIGMAVVRPAEFIILRFSHKMQEV